MKFYAVVCAILAVSMLILPALAFSTQSETALSVNRSAQNEILQKDADSVSVFLTQTKQTKRIPLAEYLVGSVASEMPAVYSEDALKAQAIVCHTYALYRRARESLSPTPDLQGADLSDDAATYQGYWDKRTRKERWGDRFEEFEKKTTSAVEDVKEILLTYDGEPIAAAYFALSAGRTESAANVFGTELPYLQSVTSDADTLSPDCSKTILLHEDEFIEGLHKIGVLQNSDDLPENCIGERTVLESGIVRTVEICGMTVTGQQFRDAFSLNSAAFNVEKTESGYSIHTMGHGHFVGMSQYGAQQMALSGADYRHILHHYYTDVTLSDE